MPHIEELNGRLVNLQAEVDAGGGGGGGGSVTLSEAQADLGSVWRTSGSFTLTDGTLTPATKLLIQLGPGPYTGKGAAADEFELTGPVLFAAVCGSGSATVYWTALFPQRGFVKINYLKG